MFMIIIVYHLFTICKYRRWCVAISVIKCQIYSFYKYTILPTYITFTRMTTQNIF